MTSAGRHDDPSVTDAAQFARSLGGGSLAGNADSHKLALRTGGVG